MELKKKLQFYFYKMKLSGDNRKITTFGVEDENAFSAKITYPADQAAPSAFLARDPSQPNGKW